MTSQRLQERIDTLQAQRAAEWLEVLKARRPEDLAAFAAWCRESPVHVREFLEASWVHQELSRLGADQELDVDALLAEIAPGVRAFPENRPIGAAASARVTKAAEPSASGKRASTPRVRRALAAAACFVAVAGGLALWLRHDSKPEYTTEVGEQRVVELADASIVKLNTNSQIKVDFAKDVRQVQLRRGEAVFKVAQDRNRPFRVHTRAATVIAVGTQFNVYDRPNGTDVTVLEGRVRVTARDSGEPSNGSANAMDLKPGEEAQISLNGTIRRVTKPDLDRVSAWSQRRLKFERAPLEEIVREFNRYNHVQMRLEGIPPESRFYRGVFDADDPDSLAALLERENGLVVERSGEEIVIRER